MPPAPALSIADLAVRHRPHVLASEENLPLGPALAELLGTPGLRRGSTVVVEGAVGSGATALALALPAAASTDGSWVAAVDLPHLGVVAAGELGLAPDRLVLVPDSGGRFATVVGALLDACDVVVAGAPAALEPPLARRLAARARERRAVLVVLACAAWSHRTGVRGGGNTARVGGPQGGGARAGGARAGGAWSDGVDARLAVFPARFEETQPLARLGWTGLGEGHGHLSTRLVEVLATRRRSAPPRVRVRLWLPSPAGTVALETPATEAPASGMPAVELAQ